MLKTNWAFLSRKGGTPLPPSSPALPGYAPAGELTDITLLSISFFCQMTIVSRYGVL